MRSSENLKVYEHEIPVGSRLYVGKSAELKRKIERLASEILVENGFSEIVSPYFSYHQHLSVSPTQLLRFSDSLNHEVSLRADSTVDVVRIVKARLKNTASNRWFYIQPVFRYPSTEIYQIGAEIIGESKLRQSINIVKNIFKNFEISPTLQISNIEIPITIAKILNIDIGLFERIQIEQILSLNIEWLNKLALLSSVDELKEAIEISPKELQKPLNRLLELAQGVEYANVSIVALYYSKMRYYDKLFFRFIDQNSILSGGGSYEIDGEISSGFAIYTDALIDKIKQEG
ncbi:ATP phosphoribosyltransferase regulatory subunit [Campylobacter majalis]|uniref:ATP phosphoribosyltransferase regulatory subunit n=1 Tax=Campylobacter majalis TaxID=2790656 RepID=A0ABM8Q3S9_9BACT|nr:ATP phosphoribosyltransferase regulatory subunit [Campylobacter majalis]CAD7287538.1 ATP phosphoribosyltransferase regulatory subunit [Campylobacter majalis]